MKSFKEYLNESANLKFKKSGDHYQAKTKDGDFEIINNRAAGNGNVGWSLFISTNRGEDMVWLDDSKVKRDLVSYANQYAKDNGMV